MPADKPQKRHIHVTDAGTIGGNANVEINTWRDWLRAEGLPEPDPDTLLTREQVLEQLGAFDASLSPQTLQAWERDGILPRAARQWHRDAVRAIYPPWFPHWVMTAKLAKRYGQPTEETVRKVRELMRVVYDEYQLMHATYTQGLADLLRQFADGYAAIYGERPDAATLHLHRGPTRQTIGIYPFDLNEDRPEPPTIGI